MFPYKAIDNKLYFNHPTKIRILQLKLKDET